MMSSSRFVETVFHKARISSPVENLKNTPVVSLLQAIQPLKGIIDKVEDNAKFILAQCNDPADGLTQNQSAAIKFYTYEANPMKNSIYLSLNNALRSEEPSRIRPWDLYMRLLVDAIVRLPDVEMNIFRGVREIFKDVYVKGRMVKWWAFTSCTEKAETLRNEQFLGIEGDRTLFEIHCTTGKNISNHSFLDLENEVILLPARKFEVLGSVSYPGNLHIVQLQEITSVQDRFELALFTPTPVVNTVNQTWNTAPSNTSLNQSWSSHGAVVANNVNWPYGITMNPMNGILYIVDSDHHRVLAWTLGKNAPQVVAGGRGSGKSLNQLCSPTDICFDMANNSIIVCDRNNKRVIRWSLEPNTTTGQILVDNVECFGVAIDREGALYVSNTEKHEVRRYLNGDRIGQSVAGGNGMGPGLNQLHTPYFIALDDQGSLYISDNGNNRVVKWIKGASQGTIVAGCGKPGRSNEHLFGPYGIAVDSNRTVFVTENGNDRVTCWPEGEKISTTIVGGNGNGNSSNELHWPIGICFDDRRNLYVADSVNKRIMRYTLE